MKLRTCYLLLLLPLICASFAFDIAGQDKKTIVLVRHVEKDASATADKNDPDLSAEGRERAQRLAKVVKKYKPHEIFSTDFKRTKMSVEPIAAKRNKQIQTYDSAKMADLVQKIMSSKTEHYLIVGHSNTIPALGNLIVKREIFRPLLESEYSIVWVIRMRKGVMKNIEIFTY